jgi:hypothetical protein
VGLLCRLVDDMFGTMPLEFSYQYSLLSMHARELGQDAFKVVPGMAGSVFTSWYMDKAMWAHVASHRYVGAVKDAKAAKQKYEAREFMVSFCRVQEARERAVCLGRRPMFPGFEEAERTLFELCGKTVSVDVAALFPVDPPCFRAYARTVCERFKLQRGAAGALNELARNDAHVRASWRGGWKALLKEDDGLLPFRLDWGCRLDGATEYWRCELERMRSAASQGQIPCGRRRIYCEPDADRLVRAVQLCAIRIVWLRKLRSLPSHTRFVFHPEIRRIVRAYMRVLEDE